MTDAVTNAAGWVLDVDGCLVRTDRAGGSGGALVRGAAELVATLRELGRRVIVCTNASERPPATYLKHLRTIGLAINDDEFVTAGSAAAGYIAAHHAGARVLALGSDGLVAPLRDAAVDVTTSEAAEVVVIGAAERYETPAINAACVAVEAGAPLYVTVDVRWFYGGRGRSISSSSAIAAAVAWVTGVSPVVVGKPSMALAETLLRRLGSAPSSTVVVGDATIEIALARAMGAHSVLVLSGATDRATAESLRESARPDVVLEDVGALYDLIRTCPAAMRSTAR